MPIRYDEKGKYFTDVITKQRVWCVIQTPSSRIEGYIFTRINRRVKDEMNTSEQFMAVSDAIIYDLSGNEIQHCKFLLVNRDQVVWLSPRQEDEEDAEGDGGLFKPGS